MLERFDVGFLSCLYGSERRLEKRRTGRGFLSCLYGSEPGSLRYLRAARFLSCLYGSERACCRVDRSRAFLSCLYGSERANLRICEVHRFLSCLYGSELAPNPTNTLKQKTNPTFLPKNPLFTQFRNLLILKADRKTHKKGFGHKSNTDRKTGQLRAFFSASPCLTH